jgi:hypothetical protein
MLFFASLRYHETIMSLQVARKTNPPRAKTPARPHWSYAPEFHSDGARLQAPSISPLSSNSLAEASARLAFAFSSCAVTA